MAQSTDGSHSDGKSVGVVILMTIISVRRISTTRWNCVPIGPVCCIDRLKRMEREAGELGAMARIMDELQSRTQELVHRFIGETGPIASRV